MRVSEILPSKWLQRVIIIILAVTIVSITAHTLYTNYQERQLQQEVGIKVSYVDLEDEQFDVDDDDRDGVPNWEEVLWGLNPQKVDTDNDGVDDKTYIEQKKALQRKDQISLEGSSRLTQSEELGRSLYTALLAIEQSGGVLDVESSEQISDNIVEYIETLPVTERLYLREDLNLVQNSQENMYTYGDTMERLIVTYPIESNDLELVIQAIENSDPYETRIDRLATSYSMLVGELATIPVPFAIAGTHTEFLNSIAHIAQTFQELNNPQADELVLFSAVVQMRGVLEQSADAVVRLETFFEIISDDTLFKE